MKKLLSTFLASLALTAAHADGESGLVINELMASNAGMVMSPAINFDSWIELYNTTDKSINLAGMYLSNDKNNLTLWQMPSDVGSVPAKGFLVVWLGSDDIKSNQAPFKLDCDGGTIYLSDKNGQLVASQEYPMAMSRTAYARTTDNGDSWGWTSTPTPGETNITAIFASQRLDAPVVNLGSQLFSGSLNVKVDIPEGATLMYTTDGSLPTAPKVADEGVSPWIDYVQNGDSEGPECVSLISRDAEGGGDKARLVDGAGYNNWQTGQSTGARMQSIVFNLNVERKDNYYYFDDVSWELSTVDMTAEPDPSQKSEDGLFTLNNTTNLTFRLFKDGYLPSVPVTRSYIKTTNKYTLPVVSIVGDRKYFTDPKIGIDCNGDGTNGKTGNGQDQPRNYNEEWDRPVNFSYMNAEGQMLHNQDVNIKVSGGWTRSQRFRSFKLKASKIFDGQNRYDYSFYDAKPYIRSKTLLVRNGGNDIWVHNARFMDPALETIIQRSGIDIDVQSYQPVIEYVNGELRGVLNLREPNNDDFAYANFGYDDEELDAFENMKMKNGDDEVINRIFELGRNATDEAAYNELKTLLDIDEFTNYMAVTMFLDNDDWPNNNIKAYRSRNDGRYRFVSFDLDYAFALRNFNNNGDNPFSYFLQFKDNTKINGEGNANREIVRLLLNLLGRDDYRRKFIDTFSLIAGSVFEPTRAGMIVDELLANVQQMCQLMKQQGINDGHDPDRAANTIKNKLQGRAKKMAGHLKGFSYAQLSEDAKAVKLKTDTDGARLYVNGLEVPYADFDGYLFAPVELKATAPAGYKFVGWKKGNATYSSDETIKLPNENNITMTATFTKLSDSELAAQSMTPVRINEVSAANGIHVNEYFKRNDWVELYNTTDQPIDVEGMYLSDNAKKPQKYQIGKGESVASTIIPAHGYLVVWCDKLDPQSQLHASFKLDADGGDVLLTAADESWTDVLTYTVHNEDQTVGRYPDGSNQVFVMNVPTIAKTNITSSYALNISDGPSTGISEHMMTRHEDNQQIYNLNGQVVNGALAPGIYIKNGRKFVVTRK